MFSVFSKNMKMSDQIRELQTHAGKDFERFLLAGPEDEPLYMLKPKVIDILKWANQKILYELPKTKDGKPPTWVGVRLRIATNMLNKEVDSGILTKETAIAYHERLTSRVRKILGEIYTEDLPF